MKKLLTISFLLGFFLALFDSAKANEYQLIKFTKNNPNINNLPLNTPGINIFGVDSSGNETLLKTWSQTNVNTEYFGFLIGDAIIDDYNGKMYFKVSENTRESGGLETYTVEYDLVNNSISKNENIDVESNISYPIGVKKMISEKSDGSIHIGENSAIFKEENGREKFWAQDANGKSIPIDITNGSKLLINGRDVEQSINNVGALSAALTGLPTVPTDTTIACGLGTGTHGGDFAFSGGCASKVNEKLSINYAASMTMPGQDYAGDFEDQFSARAGFVWKLGKSVKSSLISMKTKEKMEVKINALEENNKKIISQNKALLARLERLEKIALRESKSQDLATIKLP